MIPTLMPNVRQAVPFLSVTDMDRSVRYYVEGLGFRMVHRWEPEGKLRWCWLELGHAALMLQELDRKDGGGKLGEGVGLYFMCRDALEVHRDATSRGVAVERPFVGNGLWVVPLTDPDGYKIFFESPTDAAEGSVWAGDKR